MRIALACAGLFVVTGGALIAITYALVDHNLPAAAPTSTMDANRTAKLDQVCLQATDPVHVRQCKEAFAAGEQSATAQQRDQTLNGLLFSALTSLVGLTAAAAALGWLLSGRVLRPLRAVTEAARRASERNLSERLALHGPADELKELADTFDGMLDRLNAAFDSQRRFVANASHELRTPLTIMRTAVEVTLAKPNRTPAQYEAMAAEVRHAVAGAEAMIDALLTLARSDQGPSSGELVDLATAAEDALDAAANAVRAAGIDLRARFEPAEIHGDRVLLERMVANLVDNATRHNMPGGWISVATGRDGSGVRLTVSNSGPVIPAETVPALFEPFRRLHERIDAGHGVGLGLAIVRSVVHSHGGVITAEALPAGGLACQVVLPAAEPPPGS
ncbi:MAG TPA: ATP-binding protein [Amycolatopsis sp.]|jgi:signal transduction histidine kinase|nr:ATP-binding protein [Amycolatopsis sp.]